PAPPRPVSTRRASVAPKSGDTRCAPRPTTLSHKSDRPSRHSGIQAALLHIQRSVVAPWHARTVSAPLRCTTRETPPCPSQPRRVNVVPAPLQLRKRRQTPGYFFSASNFTPAASFGVV